MRDKFFQQSAIHAVKNGWINMNLSSFSQNFNLQLKFWHCPGVYPPVHWAEDNLLVPVLSLPGPARQHRSLSDSRDTRHCFLRPGIETSPGTLRNMNMGTALEVMIWIQGNLLIQCNAKIRDERINLEVMMKGLLQAQCCQKRLIWRWGVKNILRLAQTQPAYSVTFNWWIFHEEKWIKHFCNLFIYRI